jgi:hypothetical protein
MDRVPLDNCRRVSDQNQASLLLLRYAPERGLLCRHLRNWLSDPIHRLSVGDT